MILAKKSVIKQIKLNYKLLKSKLKEWSQSSHRRLEDNLLEENLIKKEMESLKNLSKNPDMVIQMSDKGNAVAILDKKHLHFSIFMFWLKYTNS